MEKQRFTHSVLFNLLGQGAPALVGLFAVPIFIKDLGTDRFGILSLSWMLVGYFGLFDMGISRALTKLVAETTGTASKQELRSLVWTGLILMTLMGLVGALTVFCLSPWLVEKALRIPEDLKNESLRTFHLMSLGLPLLITFSGFRGVLEGQNRFDLTNVAKGMMGVSTFLGPLAILPFSRNLVYLSVAMVVGWVLSWVTLMVPCFHMTGLLHGSIVLDRRIVKRLLKFGGWMTVTNTVGPLMVYFDRFVIGGLISITAVAYYTAPYDAVTKVGIFPSALVGVLFPAISASFSRDLTRTSEIYEMGFRCIFLVMFPIAVLITAFAPEGLQFWVGSDFRINSTLVLQCLAIGVFLNCLAYVPYTLIQGAGRPDLTAKLHLIELPLYLFAIWALTYTYGILGAAIGWTARVALDTILLFFMANRLLPGEALFKKRMILTFLTAFSMTSFTPFSENLAIRGVLLILFFIWFAILLFTDLLAHRWQPGVQHLIASAYRSLAGGKNGF